MAVELRENKEHKKGTLEFLFSYQENDENDNDEEKLTYFTEYSYGFPQSNTQTIEMKQNTYIAESLRITPKLHKGSHDAELVVIHSHKSRFGKEVKFMVCFYLKKATNDDIPDIQLPLKTLSLDTWMSHEKNPQYYKTRNDYHVVICPGPLTINGDDLNQLQGNSKSLYKELMEPEVFDVLRSIVTLQDNSTNRIIDTSTATLNRKLVQQESIVVEGFQEGNHSYMECEILEEDNSDEYEEKVLMSLKENSFRYWYTSVATVAQGLILFLVFGYAIPPLVISGASKELFNRSIYAGTIYDIIMWIVFTAFLILFVLTFFKDIPPILSIIFSGIFFSNFIGYWTIYKPDKNQLLGFYNYFLPYGNNHLEN